MPNTSADVLPSLILERTSGVPPYRQIVEFVHKQVRSGEWKEGDRVPSVAHWKDNLGVAKATVQKATAELLQDGTLLSRPGAGTFVAGPKPKPGAQATRSVLSFEQIDPLAKAALPRMLNRLNRQFEKVEIRENVFRPDIRHVTLAELPTIRDTLVPLDDILASATGRDFSKPDPLDFLRIDGVHYTVPISLNVFVLGFNHERFAARGLAYPTADWTWEEMVDAAEALHGDDGCGFAAAPPAPVLLGLLFNNGGDFLDVSGRRCLLAEPAAIEAARCYRELGRFSTRHDEEPQAHCQAAPNDFATGRAAMVYAGVGTWYHCHCRGQFTMGAVPFPARRCRRSYMSVNGFSLDRQAPCTELGLEALRLLAEADIWPGYPPPKAPVTLVKSNELSGALGEAYRSALGVGRTILADVEPARRGYSQLAAWPLVQSRLEEILYSPEPVERIMADVARQVDQFLVYSADRSGLRFTEV